MHPDVTSLVCVLYVTCKEALININDANEQRLRWELVPTAIAFIKKIMINTSKAKQYHLLSGFGLLFAREETTVPVGGL